MAMICSNFIIPDDQNLPVVKKSNKHFSKCLELLFMYCIHVISTA